MTAITIGDVILAKPHHKPATPISHPLKPLVSDAKWIPRLFPGRTVHKSSNQSSPTEGQGRAGGLASVGLRSSFRSSHRCFPWSAYWSIREKCLLALSVVREAGCCLFLCVLRILYVCACGFSIVSLLRSRTHVTFHVGAIVYGRVCKYQNFGIILDLIHIGFGLRASESGSWANLRKRGPLHSSQLITLNEINTCFQYGNNGTDPGPTAQGSRCSGFVVASLAEMLCALRFAGCRQHQTASAAAAAVATASCSRSRNGMHEKRGSFAVIGWAQKPEYRAAE